jgi:hypothetical protein
MLNRSEIFRSAWAGYRLARPAIFDKGDETGVRRFLPDLFARQLRAAWERAKKSARRTEGLTAPVVASAVNLLVAVKDRQARITEIDGELRTMDYSDTPTNWDRRLSLRAERSALVAAA